MYWSHHVTGHVYCWCECKLVWWYQVESVELKEYGSMNDFMTLLNGFLVNDRLSAPQCSNYCLFHTLLDVPFKVGARYIGRIIYNHCSHVPLPDKWQINVVAVQQNPTLAWRPTVGTSWRLHTKHAARSLAALLNFVSLSPFNIACLQM